MKNQTKTQFYLEELREKLSKAENKRIFDKRMYELLNVPSQTFSNYINGTRTMPDHVAVKVADYLHLERLQIIAEIHKENAETEEEKETWTKALKLIASGFGGIALTGALSLAPVEKAHAGISSATAHFIYYTNKLKWIISCFAYVLSISTHKIDIRKSRKWKNALEMSF